MKNNNGFIKIYRSLLNWEWYKDANVKDLYLHCLLKANWTEGKFQGKIIPVGSFVTSYKHLSEETGLSVKQVRTALEKLENTQNVTRKSTNKYTLISVVNYTLFQGNEIEKGNQTDNQRANKGQQYKNIKNIKNNIYNTPSFFPSSKKGFNNYSTSNEMSEEEKQNMSKMYNKYKNII